MASRQKAFESAREEILADLQLAELALAAMDSEPVAWRWRSGPDKRWHLASRGDLAGEVEPLYRHAQPAPVVPEEATPDSIEILASARRRDRAVFQWDEDQRNAAADSWNACRAAMLAAAPQSPGSEPATVPGKWIPVSEQMPIDFEAVIAFDGDQVYGEAMYSSDDGFTIDGYEPCDRLKLQNVTHWMPLPAAPQEVKGE
ncbi:Eaa1 [Klebsiella pneumoniae]|nr:Eaa1 [Klebsiella pneumoniae]